MLDFAKGSVAFSLIGIGQRSRSFSNSGFSSERTDMCLNSSDIANILKTSIKVLFFPSSRLYIAIDE